MSGKNGGTTGALRIGSSAKAKKDWVILRKVAKVKAPSRKDQATETRGAGETPGHR